MDAMILAAGLGSRLGEITQHTPKALVEVAGRSALERVAGSLIAAGADRLIINVHHHADAIVAHVEERGGFGVEVVFSREEGAPLETGGGLRHAAGLFRRDDAFLLHNVDILCNADLAALHGAHRESGALATLAVNQRPTTRLLLFDDAGLCGREDGRTGERRLVRPASGGIRAFAFAGIHAASPELLDVLPGEGAFSVMDGYLELAAAGARILPHDVTSARWLEVGSPARLEEARRALAAEAEAGDAMVAGRIRQ
jgi:NDP-sugar pyrophosphorylase family protein